MSAPKVAPLTGAAVLARVEEWLTRYVSYPHEHARTAHVAWIAHTHLISEFDDTPRLAFLSPEPGSGKSRALEVTEPLVIDPMYSINVSVAYLFRKIGVGEGEPLPTLLFDEVDSIFDTRGKSESSEELRGLLNSGYHRSAMVGRAVVRGKEVSTEEWPVFCPVALAGLNALPDTLMTRSVIIQMRRRAPHEKIQPFRRRTTKEESNDLRQELAEWALSVRASITFPDLPEGITDRAADVWEPLIATAEAAGGDWPARVRAAAVFMVAEQSEKPPTLGVRLLADIRTVLGDGDAIRTTDLLDRLCNLETAPWANLKGAPIDARFLARQLAKYEITTNNTIRLGSLGTMKGYRRQHFADAWDRYLPPLAVAAPIDPDAPF